MKAEEQNAAEAAAQAAEGADEEDIKRTPERGRFVHYKNTPTPTHHQPPRTHFYLFYYFEMLAQSHIHICTYARIHNRPHTQTPPHTRITLLSLYSLVDRFVTPGAV